MSVLLTVLFWVILVGSIFLIPFNLPGTFIIVFTTLGYQLIDKVPGVQWAVILILLVIAVGLELFEYFVTVWSSKKYGGSNYGTAGAVAGSILGAIFGTSILPLIGSILGAFLGGFLGAYVLEYFQNRDRDRAFSVGKGAFIGIVSGKTGKIVGAIAMLIIIASNMS